MLFQLLRFLGVLFVGCGLTVCSAQGQPATARVDMTQVQSAWQQRQDRVRSLRAILAQEATVHRGYYLTDLSALSEQLAALGAQPPVVPDKDVYVTYDSSVILKGNRNFRYSYTRREWNPDQRDLELVEYVATSNPDARIFFHSYPNSNRKPSASVSDRPTSDETVVPLVPLILAVRPERPFRKRLADYSPTGQSVEVEGRACAEIRTKSRGEGETRYKYLDPERGWTARRIDVYNKDSKLLARISAEYKQDSIAGWLPSGWSYITQSPDGTPHSSGKVTVKHYEVNVELLDSEFQPKFPPGTFVSDDTKGDWQKSTVSVVKSDGSKGVELPLGEQPSYAQLLGANASARRQRIWLYVFITVGIAVFAVATAYWYRRRRAARGTLVAGP